MKTAEPEKQKPRGENTPGTGDAMMKEQEYTEAFRELDPSSTVEVKATAERITPQTEGKSADDCGCKHGGHR